MTTAKETLDEKQIKFSLLIARLIFRAYEMGYGVTVGDFFRDPRCPYGSEVSLHKERLAADLNLFRRGPSGWEYCQSTEDHRPLGEYWQSLDPDCEWGGDGDRHDGNHYSISYRGRW